MRFFLGLIVGALLGSGGTYLALEKPWQGEPGPPALDAGPEVAADTGKKKKKRKKKRRKRKKGDVEITVEGEVPELTAADRKMLWKGDAVKLPKRDLDMGAGDQGRPMNGSEINGAMKSQSRKILDCITSSRGNAPLAAEIKVKMLVDGNGKVTRSRFRAPAYLFAHGFHGCARKAASGMRFPATGAHTVVEVPFHLD